MATTNEFTAPQLITKQPGEKRKVSMDFSNWVNTGTTLSGPTIASELVGGGASDLAISSIVISGKKVVCFIDAGTNAKNYEVKFTVTTSDGETLQGTGMLRVINK